MVRLVAILDSFVMTSSSSTIPDDFLNLYPDDVPDNLGDLAGTGFAPTPLLIGAVLLLIVGLVAMTGRRKRRV